MLGLLDIGSISINILVLGPITMAITVRALVWIGVGGAVGFVALEKTRGWVPRILLALHQLAEAGNARGHAERPKPEVGLGRTFHILRSTESSASTARLIKGIGFTPVDTCLNSFSPG
jgi:hypothetical protein